MATYNAKRSGGEAVRLLVLSCVYWTLSMCLPDAISFKYSLIGKFTGLVLLSMVTKTCLSGAPKVRQFVHSFTLRMVMIVPFSRVSLVITSGPDQPGSLEDIT